MPRAASQPKPGGRVRVTVACAAAVLVAIAAWWLRPRGRDVSTTVAVATGLLDAGGRPDPRAIRRLVADVDRMPRDDLAALRLAVGEEWRRRRQESIDRYFTAPAGEKPRLLDDEIERLEALHELLLALNPQADVNEPPRLPREPKAGAPEPGAATGTVARRYEEALAARARERRVRLPAFR